MEVKPIDSKITKTTLVLFLLNILAIIVFADKISITVHDAFTALCFASNIWSITAAYLYERKNKKWGWLLLHSRNFFLTSVDKKAREKKFDLMLIIHCSLLPFYLPTAFLTYKLQCVIPTMVLFIIPTIVSQTYNTIDFFTTAHKNKVIQQQKDAIYEKERIEQERREELGQWK